MSMNRSKSGSSIENGLTSQVAGAAPLTAYPFLLTPRLNRRGGYSKRTGHDTSVQTPADRTRGAGGCNRPRRTWGPPAGKRMSGGPCFSPGPPLIAAERLAVPLDCPTSTDGAQDGNQDAGTDEG